MRGTGGEVLSSKEQIMGWVRVVEIMSISYDSSMEAN